MNSEQYLKSKCLRKQANNEIIIDIDDASERGLLCYMQTGINLVGVGYHIEVWYASGMKNPHIHIKNIINLDGLSSEEGTKYRKLFFEKYIPKEYWNEKIPDYSIANTYEEAYHPIAEENKPHYKYGTIKILRSEFNKGNINQIELDLLEKSRLPELPEFSSTASRILHFSDKKNYSNYQNFQQTLSGKIAQNISIFSIADSFGLKPLGKKIRVCCFHNDSNPSLSLNDEMGFFNCFGCHASGGIIKFYALLKEINSNFKLGDLKQ